MPQKANKGFSAMSGCHKQAWYSFPSQRILVSKQIGENTCFQKNPIQKNYNNVQRTNSKDKGNNL